MKNALQYYVIAILVLALLLTIIVNIHIPDHNYHHNNGRHKALRTRENYDYENVHTVQPKHEEKLQEMKHENLEHHYNTYDNTNSNNIDHNLNANPKKSYDKETIQPSKVNEVNAQDIISSHPFNKFYSDLPQHSQQQQQQQQQYDNINYNNNNKISNQKVIGKVDSLIDETFSTIPKQEYFSVLKQLYNQNIKQKIDDRKALKSNTHNKHHDIKATENLNLDYVNLFQKALKEGEICHHDTLAEAFVSLNYGIKEIISVANPKLFIEMSSYSVSKSLATEISKSYPSLTNILLQYSNNDIKSEKPSLDNEKIECKEQNLSNMFISQGEVGRNNILGSFDCVQVIDDYSILTTGQLPFEFEEMLGQILCRCNISVVPRSLPSTPYFSIWETTSSLLKASITAASSLSTDSCNIALETDLKLSNSLTIKRNYYIVQRFANSTRLSTTSGHISSESVAALPLIDTSKHHILSSVLEHVISSPLDVESIITDDESPILLQLMKKFVVSGSKVRSCNDTIEEREYINKHHLVFPIPEADEVSVAVNETTEKKANSSDTKGRRRLLGTISTNVKRIVSTTWEFSDEVINDHLTSIRDIDSEYLKALQEIENGILSMPNENDENSQGTIETVSNPSITSDARMRQRSMQDREYNAYIRWMSILSTDSASHSIAKSNLVYIFGKHNTLLSAKLSKGLSKRNPHGLLVTVSTDSQSIEPHLLLNDVMKAKNNLICEASLSEMQIGALVAAPEQADVNIIQLDVSIRLLTLSLSRAPLASRQSDNPSSSIKTSFESIEDIFEINDKNLPLKPNKGNCGIDLFEDMMSTMLSLSRITYIEIPSILSIVDIVAMLLPSCKDFYSQLYSTSAIILKNSANNIVNAQVEMKELIFHEKSHNDYSALTLKVTINTKKSIKNAVSGISIYTLLHLGVSKNQKRSLFRLYTELPIWSVQSDVDNSKSDKVRPWNVFAKLSGDGYKNSMSLWHYSMYKSQPACEFGTSLGTSTISSEMRKTKLLWSILSKEFDNNKGELAGERFSIVEHNSGYGYLSGLIAKRFPNATVISLENDPKNVEYHLSIIKHFDLLNNAVCAKVDDDHSVIKHIYESPELFRFQIINNALLELFISSSLSDWGENVGMLLSSAMTSFVTIPSAAQVSLAMQVFFSEYGNPYRPIEDVLTNSNQDDADMLHLSSLNSIHGHPMKGYEDFERSWLLGSANVKGGSTQMSIAPISIQLESSGKHIPIVRCDILNMTRHVHHHYNYAKDGHTRTYTMHVQVNETLTSETKQFFGNVKELSTFYSKQESKGIQISTYSTAIDSQENSIGGENADEQLLLPPGAHPNRNKITTVSLERDKDSFPIPYISLYGITLISVLRIGLENSLRDRLFQSFLKLPLYEDMAPWNVVLMGQTLDYIDYDSREIKFDGDIPKTYLLMAVLMNYKRTVEDFKRCGSKASTVYGLPYVSDCVGGSSLSKNLKCPDMKEPVPCGDGKCHTDYISCLKSLEVEADKLAKEEQNEKTKDHLMKTITSAMEYSTGFITEKGFIPEKN